MKLSAARACALLVIVAFMAVPMLPASAQQPRRGGTLRIAHIGEPPTLDHHWTTAVITGDIMHNVNEGLFALTNKYEPRPLLVEKWSMAPDRMTYTFTLRRGVRFHNGKEL
ncbi:MAG TPA: ABC transporter substrate-binding protein, partial [bacterium]|nr:ABC transporter substrate-binding protein [bacterium]